MKKLIIQILLAGIIIFLGYKCYQSIMIPQRFTEIKKQRYERIAQRLKDIRTAQEAKEFTEDIQVISIPLSILSNTIPLRWSAQSVHYQTINWQTE